MNTISDNLKSVLEAQIERLDKPEVFIVKHMNEKREEEYIKYSRDEREVSYRDFLDKEYIPSHDINSNFPLRTLSCRFGEPEPTKEDCYAETAHMAYLRKYSKGGSWNVETFNENPNPEAIIINDMMFELLK